MRMQSELLTFVSQCKIKISNIESGSLHIHHVHQSPPLVTVSASNCQLVQHIPVM